MYRGSNDDKVKSDPPYHPKNLPVRYVPVGVIALAGLVLFTVTFTLIRNLEKNKIQTEFERAAENRIMLVKNSIESSILIIESIGAFFAASREVERSEFREFVKPLTKNHHGIQALEWIPRVPDSHRLRLEAVAVQEGFPDFKISERKTQGEMVEAARRDEYFPVFFVEPYGGNELALGYDLASDPARRAALIKARDSAEIVASSRIKLVQETGRQFGFLIFLPVYRKGGAIDSLVDRRLNLQGFVLGVFRIPDIVENALNSLTPEGIDFSVHDLSAPVDKQRLYFHSSRKRKENISLSDGDTSKVAAEWHHTDTFNIAGRKWSVQCTPTKTFIAAQRTWQVREISAFILLFTLFSVIFFLLDTRRKNQLLKSYHDLQIEIEDRKRAEQAVLESERKLRAIFDQTFQFIGLMEIDGTMVDANRAALNFASIEKEEVLGKPFWETIWWAHSPELQDRLKAAVGQAADGNFVRFEASHAAPDGDVHYVDLSIMPVKDDAGNVILLIPEGRDVTERKQAEDALRKSEKKLDRAKRMESLGLMAGGIAHDLNNILSGIVSYPDLLLMDMPKDSPLRQPLETIKESGQRAADVVSDLLTVTRGVATGKELLDLNIIVDGYLNSAEYLEQKKRHPYVNLTTRLETNILNINGSHTYMKKALMNLVINALEAVENNGTITIATSNRYIDVTDTLPGYVDIRPGEYVLLTVADNGVGISEEDLARIFEPFYTKKIMGRSGTGLGLAVVWNTIQDHEGYINVNSDANGSVFDLYFPATRKVMTADREALPILNYLGHGQKILVVDDEKTQREIACTLLTKLGYTAEAVSSGEEAVEYLQKNPVDLIVLDMIMPRGMNGRETYEEIIKIHPDQMAIIASGFAETEDVKVVQTLGAGEFIKKPYTLEKFGLAIKEEFEGRRGGAGHQS